MENKVLKTLSKNLGFKILAVVFAFTLWLIVYNIDDPIKSKTVTVSVNLTNKEYAENLGKYYEIKDNTNKVSFSVTAARSILDKLDETDFTATANMEQITISEDGTEGIVPIEVIYNNSNNANSVRLSASNKNLKLALEDSMTKQFVVTASAIGQVAEGYALGNIEVTAPNVLRIAGPKSIVENIFSVIATIDVTGMSDAETSYRATPLLFNESGKEIDTARLSFSDETVTVTAEILNVKEVPIVAKYRGTPASGYEVIAVHSTPYTIQLKGSKSILNSVNEIVIPSSVVSISKAEGNVTATVDVTEYIPSGTTLAEPEQATVEIVVGIGRTKEKTFDLKTKNITVTGLPTGSKISFALSSVAVEISGQEADVNLLSNETLTGSIDVTGLSEGTHYVKLNLDLDDVRYKYKTVSVKVTIKK